MKISKNSLLYTVYIICITGFFLYYLFPSDTLKKYLEYRLSQGNQDITVSIDHVSPVLPPGVKLHSVGIAQQNKRLLELDNVKLMPAILPLLQGKTTVNFKGLVNSGTLTGQADIRDDPKGPQISGIGKISGVQVQGIPILQNLPAKKISGVLNGDFTYAAIGSDRSLAGKLNLSQCRIELKEPLFNLTELDFRTIDADLELADDTVKIKNSNAKGNLLDADITGTIVLADQPDQTALNLSISVIPHHTLLAKIEKMLPMNLLRSTKTGKGAISFKVNGTWNTPGYSLN